ncbi:MAG TPA: hypothetical protein VHD90_14410 [Phototrophicaceae bacterium]|nr:hypothetical protein [Phototrophicaceae bacterium]
MIELPKNYYHCFLGNGLDAVLVGYTGSMVADRVSVDRCAWYKSDRYYPEDKLVMVAGRWPLDKKLEHAEGSGWYDVAPLGRTWYYVMDGSQRLELKASEQHFEPKEGTLYSNVDYGSVKAKVETWLHATESILIERYTFDREVEFQAWMGPGVWSEDNGMSWDTDPFRSVTMSDDAPEGRYDCGETNGLMALRVEPEPISFSTDGLDRCLTVRATTITKYFLITDNKQGEVSRQPLDAAVARGYDALRAEHLDFWKRYFAVSNITIPDERFQYVYDASMYHFKAMQNRDDGGIPVNNLRRTWSSHVFWDAYFIHRALMGANHRVEALEGCRFFERTMDHARRHARDEFGCDGLKWDWEITHDGRKAYGALLHMKYQVHNNASYANMLMGYYDQTLDQAALTEFYPILEGLATFFMNCIVEPDEQGGYRIGYVVGVHESPVKVRNDGTTVAGAIAILRHCARAAQILGKSNEFTEKCSAVADSLMKTMDSLYNGHFFKASEADDRINMSSIAPISPMQVIAPADPRAISTADSYIERYGGRVLGDGMHDRAFPWSAGVLGAILAAQHRGDLVWQAIEGTYPAVCNFGGMTEVMENGEWNMMYFGTAEGAVCTAIQQMLIESFGDHVDLFAALPKGWGRAGFEHMLAGGLTVSAQWTPQQVEWIVKNESPVRLSRHITYGDQAVTVDLAAGEERSGTFHG